MTDKIVVLSCCASAQEAETLAKVLVEARLAPCVSVLMQNRSFYWWKDKIEESTEHMLLIKTSQHLFDKVKASIELHHSYDLPEIVALPVVQGSESYLGWIDRELRG